MNWRRVGLRIGWWIVFLALLTSGCGRRAPVSPPPPAVVGAIQVGVASWYGHPFHGRTTANGERYNMQASTAAHKTLPFNTWVRVLNLHNKKSTVVRINDRGPFVKGRIIDLSRKAAGEIDMIRPGTARVQLQILPGPDSPASGSPDPSAPASPAEEAFYTVQVGAFRVQQNALNLQSRLAARFREVWIDTDTQSGGTFYRVRVGRLSDKGEAEELARRLRRERDVKSAIVIQVWGFRD